MKGAWRIVAEYDIDDCPQCRGTGLVRGYDGFLGDCYHRTVAWVENASINADGSDLAHTATKAGEAREMTCTDSGRPSGEINGQVGEGE